MQRYFIELAYDGTGYHGWQIQPNADTVQQQLDKALSVFFRQPVCTLGCGRTDSGVHATEFFVHVDLEGTDPSTIQGKTAGINALLPYTIAVKRIFLVPDDAHARFSATARTYEYHMHLHKDPFKLNRSWLYKWPLDVEAMNIAADKLLSFTDFTSFSKPSNTATNNCKITTAYFRSTADGLIFTISADRFLRNMVRAVVGTLLRVGRGEINQLEFESIINSQNRSNAGQSVPACGLYLVRVVYPFVN